MQQRIADIEYEQMMLSRYTIAQQRQAGGLDRSVYLLMSRIDSHGAMTIAELSHALRLDASTLQRQVTNAVKEGYLQRVTDPDGSLARKIALTAIGNQKLGDARALSINALERIMGDWAPEDIDQFAKYLHRFNISIEEYSESKRG
ncbi:MULTISPECIES: MarR family winged helix-turn-helix transcriptional regulator [unclassified Glutamicibacter]|uniref:MarR family winged helix-turn-helix transcriptional regulator n=1 Tax=unclassified Glutamicibacter TaxID=2627139 RepID=UPI00382D07D6